MATYASTEGFLLAATSCPTTVLSSEWELALAPALLPPLPLSPSPLCTGLNRQEVPPAAGSAEAPRAPGGRRRMPPGPWEAVPVACGGPL